MLYGKHKKGIFPDRQEIWTDFVMVDVEEKKTNRNRSGYNFLTATLREARKPIVLSGPCVQLQGINLCLKGTQLPGC